MIPSVTTMAAAPGERAPWWTGTRGLLAVLLLTFAVYAPSLTNEFAMDDRLSAMAVLDDGRPNPMVHELRSIGDYFGSPYWASTGAARDQLYRPITVLSHALIYRWLVPSGATQAHEALPHHLINVLLQLLAVTLVYVIVRKVSSPVAALVGSLVFGLHAIHSEVVATVVGRAELLAFCFGGAALVLYATLAQQTWRGAATAALLFLAFCSKESALAWAPFLVVFDLARHQACSSPAISPWVRLARSTPRWLLVVVPPIAAFLFLRRQAIAQVSDPWIAYVANPLVYEPLGVRVLTAVKVWGYGLLLTAFPFRLAGDYGPSVFQMVRIPLDAGLLAAVTALAALLLVGLRSFARHPLLFLTAVSFLGLSFMTSNVPMAIGTIFGERLYYAPSLAASFAAAWAATRFPHIAPAAAPAMACGLWLGMSALVILQRNPVWKDDRTFFEQEHLVQPASARLRLCRASRHVEVGEVHAAINQLRAAVELEPQFALAWNNLAAAYLDLDLLDDATAALEKALAATHIDEREDLFKIHCNLGLVAARRGLPEQAVAAFEKSVEHRPGFARSRIELLRSAMDVWPPAKLEEALRRGQELNPGDPHWTYFQGLIAHKKGNHGEAVDALRRVLQSPPAWSDIAVAQLTLADSLAHLGHREPALALLEGLAKDARVPPHVKRLATDRANLLKQ